MKPAALLSVLVALVVSPTARSEDSAVRIVTTTGEAVSGARVEVFRRPEILTPLAAVHSRLLTRTSDEAGRLPFAPPALDDLLWMVDHPDFAPRIAVGERLPRRIVLTSGAAVSGRLLGDGDDPPKGEGTVCSDGTFEIPEWGRGFDWRRCAEVGDDGRFTLAGVPPGESRLEARVPGYLPAARSWSSGEGDDALAAWKLEPGVRLSGRVTGPGGEPLVKVELATAAGRVGQTGEDGRFVMAVPSLPATVRFEAAGFRAVDRRVRVEQRELPLQVVLRPGEALRGVAVSSRGAALDRLNLHLEHQLTDDQGQRRWQRVEPRPGDEPSADSTVAAPDDGVAGDDVVPGTFEIVLPGPGRYRLGLSAPGHRALQLAAFDIAAGEIHDLGEVRLDGGAVVRGRAVDAASGEPLAGVVVRLRGDGLGQLAAALRSESHSAVSDDGGRFEIGGLSEGRYHLVGERRGFASQRREIAVPRDEPIELDDLTFDGGVDLSGRLVDRGGDGRGGLEVALFLSPADLEPERVWRTSPEGAFEDTALSPGRYWVKVFDQRLLLSRELELEAGEGRHELEWTVGGVELTGRVLRGGEPVVGGVVMLEPGLDLADRRGKVFVHGGGDLSASTQGYGLSESQRFSELEADGTFRIADVPVGRATVTIYPDQGGEVRRNIEVPDRAEARVDLEIAGGKIFGQVQDDAGSPVVASLTLIDEAGRSVALVESTAEGGFQFSDLAPGDYRVQARARGYRDGLSAVRLEGQQASLEISLGEAEDGALRVALRHPSGGPMAAVPVTLIDSQGLARRSLLTDSAGVRDFDSLAAGDYYLVWTDGLAGTGVSGPHAVTAGEQTTVDRTLGPGVSMELECHRGGCLEGAIESLRVYSREGVEVSPYLAGVSPGMRFSASGFLPLGNVEAGEYLVDVAAGGQRWNRWVSVRGGGAAVLLD